MATPRDKLKSYFAKYKKPTESQYAEMIDALWHREEDGIKIDNSTKKISVGAPNNKLDLIVNGLIESKENGIKFPDGSVQNTSALRKGWFYRPLHYSKGNENISSQATLSFEVSKEGNIIIKPGNVIGEYKGWGVFFVDLPSYILKIKKFKIIGQFQAFNESVSRITISIYAKKLNADFLLAEKEMVFDPNMPIDQEIPLKDMQEFRLDGFSESLSICMNCTINTANPLNNKLIIRLIGVYFE